MKLSAAAALIVAASVSHLEARQAPAPAAPAQAARPAPVRSPEIHPDHTVTFRLSAPKATEVTLNGSWDNATDLKMTKDESGVWSTTIGPLAPQLWGYWFMVDGAKALDPSNGETQRDGARYDNLLMIRARSRSGGTSRMCRTAPSRRSGIRRRRSSRTAGG